MFISRFFNRFRRRRYPMPVRLDYGDARLFFEVNNDVERFRIVDYGDEKDFLYSFLSELQSTDTVFDIGASVGLMTVHAAQVVRKGMVVSFEPDPQCYQRLAHNVSLNHFGNVATHQVALSNEVGETMLFTDGTNGCAPTLCPQPGRSGAPTGKVAVHTQTMDNGIEQKLWPLPTVLKIDIEGAEMLCLRGADLLLSGKLGASPRVVFLEVHPDFLPYFDADVRSVRDFLLGHGYTIEREMVRDEQVHWFCRYCRKL